MEKYMLLFREGDLSKLSAQEQQEQMGKWLVWVEKLRKENRYLSGEPLLPGGKTVTGPKTVTDGPFAESKEVIGGFFIVNAKNLDDAVNIARDCPDFEFGASVEVREVLKMDNM
jgi:hypothetical protein